MVAGEVRFLPQLLIKTKTMTIKVNRGQFSYDWTLVSEGKEFFLGQDAKFCQRVLGMSGREVVQAIGSNDLTNQSTLEKLAQFIASELGLNEEVLSSLEPWELCAQ